MPGKLPALRYHPVNPQDQADLVTARNMVANGHAASLVDAAAAIAAQRNAQLESIEAEHETRAADMRAAAAAAAAQRTSPVSSTVSDLEARLLEVEINHSKALTNLDEDAAVDLVKQRFELNRQLEQARAAEIVQHQQQTVAVNDWDAANAAAVAQHPALANPDSPMHIFVQALVNRDAESGLPDAGTAASFNRAVEAAAKAFNVAPAAPSVPSPQPSTRPPGVSLPGILGLTANAAGVPAPSAPDAEAAQEALIKQAVRAMSLQQQGVVLR